MGFYFGAIAATIDRGPEMGDRRNSFGNLSQAYVQFSGVRIGG